MRRGAGLFSPCNHETRHPSKEHEASSMPAPTEPKSSNGGNSSRSVMSASRPEWHSTYWTSTDRTPCQHCEIYSEGITNTLARLRRLAKASTFTFSQWTAPEIEQDCSEANSTIEALVAMWSRHLAYTHQAVDIIGMTDEIFAVLFLKFPTHFEP